jgi:hypothetical protein
MHSAGVARHLDVPSLMIALPAKWRYRLGPAMSKEFFKAHFFPQHYKWHGVLTNRLTYYLAPHSSSMPSHFLKEKPAPVRRCVTRGIWSASTGASPSFPREGSATQATLARSSPA